MIRYLKGGAVMTALCLSAVSVEAQIAVNPGPADVILTDAGSALTGTSCLASYSATFMFNECSGAWSGNNDGVATPSAAAVQSYVNAVWSIDAVGEAYSGGGIMGPFVMAVKGATSFSLYYFAGNSGTIDLTGVMAGVSPGNGVSHTTIYGGEIVVPEPGTMLLIGTGLLGMAALRRREEEVA